MERRLPKECTLYASSVRGFCSKWATMSLSYPGGLKVCMHRTSHHNQPQLPEKKVPVNCERVSGGSHAHRWLVLFPGLFISPQLCGRACTLRAADSTACDALDRFRFPGLWRFPDPLETKTAIRKMLANPKKKLRGGAGGEQFSLLSFLLL